MEKLRAQFEMPNNGSVKSNQVSKTAVCASAKVRNGYVFDKNTPKEILLTGWKFQINTSL